MTGLRTDDEPRTDVRADGWSSTRTRRPVSRRTLGISVAAGLAAMLFAVWLVGFSSAFGVRTVEVRGNRAVSSEAIQQAAGIAHGSALLRLDTAAIAKRVEALPGIGTASVQTHFPSTVDITVTERSAVGVVRAAGGFELVDRAGQQYQTVASRPAELPLLVLSAGSNETATARSAARVAAALPASLRVNVRSVQAQSPGAITLLLRSGRLVRWGSAAQSDVKAEVLPVLLRRHPSIIDVSNPAQPFTR